MKNFNPKILSVTKIWDGAAHSAFTDLIYFKNLWFCAFREGENHVGGTGGIIRLIKSEDGFLWETCAIFELAGIDLRDPKLSITPEGKLMLLVYGSIYSSDDVYITGKSRVAFSEDGNQWTDFTPVLEPNSWAWRITWHQNKAYGVFYTSPKNAPWSCSLVESQDGISYTKITDFNLEENPSETTVRFLQNGDMIALVRRKHPHPAMFGISSPPFTKWRWNETNQYLAAPNLLVLEDESIWATGRNYETDDNNELIEETALFKLDKNKLSKVITFPSGGDTSYTGMVYKNGFLWVSYYSEHENQKTSIYLAKVKLTS